MEPPTGDHRRRRLGPLAVVAGAVGMLLASSLIWRASSAAFTASTTNGSNTFSTGTVTITDNDSSTVMFNVGAMAPGATGSGCIRVTYNGSLPSAVKVYAASPSATNSLDTYLTLQIEDGAFSSLPAFPACTNFVSANSLYNSLLSTFGSTNTSFASGFGTWAPNGAGQTKDYRFTYTLSAATPNTVQGSTASISFVWEAQST